MIRIRNIRRVAATIFLVAGLGYTLHAAPTSQQTSDQTQQQAPPDTASAAEAPRPVPASDIARQAQEARAQLRDIRSRVELDPRVTAITDQLPELIASLEELRADPVHEDLGLHSRRRIESLRLQWLRLKAQLDAAQATLTSRSEVLGAEQGTLSQIRALWQVTSDSADDLELPQAAVDQIGAVLAAIGEIDGQIRTRLDFVITLQSGIIEEAIGAADELARIEAAQQEFRLQLLTPDAPPLWSALFAADRPVSVLSRLRASWEEDLVAISRFMADNQRRFLIHLGLFAVLLLTMVGLRRRTGEQVKEDEAAAAYAHVLARPFSAALLVALLFAPLVYPQAPSVAFDLGKLLVIVPVLRLLPGLVQPTLRKPFYGLAALYVLDQFGALLMVESVADRIVLLAIASLALVGLMHVLRPGGPLASLRGRGWRAAAGLARLGLITLPGAIAADVLGYVWLAEMLIGGTLDSAYIAAVLFASARVVDGLVTLLLRTRAASLLNSVRSHRDLLARRAARLIHLAAVVLWLDAVLWRFQLLDPLLGWLAALFNTTLTIGALSIAFGGVLLFIVALWLTLLASQFVRFLLREDVFPRLRLPRGVGDSASKIIHYTILGAGIILALAAAGVELQSFALIAGALGIGIGFGLQNLVNNFVSGLILIFERPIKLGDTVEFGTRLGIVKRIGMRSSTVRTFDGAEVIVPNGNLISSEVVNWTLSDRLRRVEVPVGVAYGSDPQRVLDILVEVAGKHSKVLEHPQPSALFIGFGDSSLDFVARFWTDSFDDWRKVSSEVSVGISEALNKAEIVIPFPQRDLHIIDRSATRELALGESEENF